jgi:hypothetical protein
MVLESTELVMYCIGELVPSQHTKDVQIQNLSKHTSILHRSKVPFVLMLCYTNVINLCSHSDNSSESDNSTYDDNVSDDDNNDEDDNNDNTDVDDDGSEGVEDDSNDGDDGENNNDGQIIDLTIDDTDDDNGDNDNNDDTRKRQCSICMNTMEPDSVKYLPCAHGFHKKCITRWLEIRHYCPICKNNVDW